MKYLIFFSLFCCIVSIVYFIKAKKNSLYRDKLRRIIHEDYIKALRAINNSENLIELQNAHNLATDLIAKYDVFSYDEFDILMDEYEIRYKFIAENFSHHSK